MKLRLASSSPRSGFALLIVLLFTAVTFLILGGTVSRTMSTARMNDRSNQFLINTSAAESATEKIIACINDDFRAGGDSALVNKMTTYNGLTPTAAESSYWTNFIFSDARGNDGRTLVYLKSVTTNNWIALDYEFQGLNGYTSDYRLVSNVRSTNSLYPSLIACVQQDVQTAEIPLFQYAIFYNSLLEFTHCATLTVRGPVHANGNIYTAAASGNTTTFYGNITSTGNVLPGPAGGWSFWTPAQLAYAGVSYLASVKTNVTSLTLPIGTNNTAAAVREVVNPPPSGEATSSAMGAQRFYNKAQLNIMVSNNSVTAWVKLGLGASISNTIPWSNNLSVFLNTNISFTDNRENKTIRTTQFDVDKYNTWAKTNSNVYSILGSPTASSNNAYVPNIVYIADYRYTNSAASTNLSAVRLTNGLTLPTNNLGLTIATPNPIYIMGNYNCPNAAYLGTTNTSASMPAAIFADALTLLSSSWVTGNYDTISTGSFSLRNAGNTTVNACLVAGIVYSGPNGTNAWSGGVMNFPRLLEEWTGDTLTLNTSMVNLYDSVWANTPFTVSGTYFNPPTRAINFDSNLTNPAKQPPGTPRLRAMIRTNWSTPPPGSTNYVGL